MFDRFTERARKTMSLARQAAQRHAHDFIGPGHVLLGMLAIPDGTHADVLARLGIDVDALRRDVDAAIGRGRSDDGMRQLPFTPTGKRCLELALAFSQRRHEGHIGTGHLLAGVAGCADPSVASLAARGIDADVISRALDAIDPVETPHAGASQSPPSAAAAPSARASVPAPTAPTAPAARTPALAAFTMDARGLEEASRTASFVARPDQTDRVIQVLSRRSHGNPVLVGPAGAGKSALLVSLARALAGSAVRSHLIGARVRLLDFPRLLAGRRGQFEERVLAVALEIRRTSDTILAIDGLGQVLDAGRWAGTGLSAADVLRPLLSTGGVPCIATATPEEHAAIVKADPALARRFQVVRVPPMSPEATLEVLRGTQAALEQGHHVRYADDAIRGAVDLAAACIEGRCLPGSAVDVLDEAGASIRMDAEGVLELRAAASRASEWIERRDAAAARSDTDAFAEANAALVRIREEAETARRALPPGVAGLDAVVGAVSAITGLPSAAVRERLPRA